MKTTGVALGAIAVLAGASLADDKGFYIKGAGGYGFMPSLEASDLDGTAGLGSDLDGDGPRFALGAGYAFGNGWRFDLDLADRFTDTGALEFNANSNSDINSVALTANIIRDLTVFDAFDRGVTPYLGVGLGAAQTRFSTVAGSGRQVTDETAIAGQFLAGLGVPLSDNLKADVEYRFFATDDVDADIGGVQQALGGVMSHDVLFGLRYTFGPQTPRREEPDNFVGSQVLACDDVPFVVYFAWDSAALTPQARRVIAQAAEQSSRCDVTRVLIEGHADRSGGESYNVGLSRRRAEVVEVALVDEGIDQDVIETVARGESEPAVDTADGVREPLNRRAEVLIEVDE